MDWGKPRKASGTVVGFPADIRTEHPPSKSVERCFQAILLGVLSLFNLLMYVSLELDFEIVSDLHALSRLPASMHAGMDGCAPP
jgi:hypothetical protein